MKQQSEGEVGAEGQQEIAEEAAHEKARCLGEGQTDLELYAAG